MKTVVIRKYDNASAAYIDAQSLRSQGIDCEVIGDSPVAVLMSGCIHLVVLEDVADKAKELLGI